ncbi:MAG: NTP transferase domain-containing protein [Epsilonproteobacteria bacterium]|nr:NTP transferase domain-containing protein [Campylobacterota bacterium]
MRAVIMAGGFGTRIQPLTNSRPKPMLPVMNKPMMEHTMKTLRDLGIKEFIVLLYFKPEVIKNYFKDGKEMGIDIKYVIPDEDYGTAGAVKMAEEYLKNDNFIIISGDLVTDFDFKKIFDYHHEKASRLTITLTSVENPLEFGVVITDEDGKIEKFLEKPSWGEVFSDTINTGIYIIEPEILDYIPQKDNFDFAKDLFPKLMEEGIDIMGYNAKGYWRDVGNPDSYREVHDDIFNERVNFKLDYLQKKEFPNGTLYYEGEHEIGDIKISGKVILAKNVKIESGCLLENVVIGENSVIKKDNKIRNSVIWENVFIDRHCYLDNCVICNDNIIGKNVKAKAGMILAEGCKIGELVSIDKDIVIWPNKIIDEAAILNNNVIWGSRYKNALFENGSIIGRSNIELSCEVVAKIAEAFGSELPLGSTVSISSDYHRSSKMLKRIFVGGLLSTGVNVIDLKIMPAAVMRYNLENNPEIVAGVHFNQSIHDPMSTTITFFNEDALRFNTSFTKTVEKNFFKEKFRKVDFTKIGSLNETEYHEECHNYLHAIKNTIDHKIINKDFTITIDLMHGNTADLLPQLLNDFQISNITLNAYHDEKKLSDIKDTVIENEKNVSKIVKNLGMNAGFLIYPNGQRIVMVTDEGEVLEKSRALLTVLSLLNLEAERKKRKFSVFLPVWAPDSMDSEFTNLEIKRGKYINFTKEKLSKFDLIATVEGNFAFKEFSVHRDSIYALLKIIEMLSATKKSLSEIVKNIKPFYYNYSKVSCTHALKGKMMRKFLQESRGKKSSTIDGVKIWESETDWILMIPDQYSNHLKLYIQAKDQKTGEEIYNKYLDKITEWSKID